MDIKDIRSFLECYETRSINKAAKSLYITPQGLGKILDRLEQELKTMLFERTARGLEPTEAGIFFYEKGHKLVDDMNEIELGIDAIRRKNHQLRVGYSCGLLRIRNTKAVEKFEKENPELSISWEEDSNSSIKEKLIARQLDVAFVVGRMPAKDMVEKELFSKNVCAVVYKGHRLFERESIAVSELKDEPIITLNENYQIYFNLLASCENEGFVPNIRVKTMDSTMIYELVGDKLGIGIDLDFHSREIRNEDIRLIPIEGFVPWKGYVAYSKEKQLDSAVLKFLEAFV